MSKINIQGTIQNIRSKSNVYTPIIEAIVNSIDAIKESGQKKGAIDIIVKRDNEQLFSEALPNIRHIEIHDNGAGFTKKNRDSFDTFYSDMKKTIGGKGFGRFLFLKYFDQVKIASTFREADGKFHHRSFRFGKVDEIIIDEEVSEASDPNAKTIVYLNYLHDNKHFDKELETIGRKILEKLLIFFVNEEVVCPTITIRESDGSNAIILNEYLKGENEITLNGSAPFEVVDTWNATKEEFKATFFKVYFSKGESKIILTGDNREVTEVALHNYVPEFEDDFFEEFEKNGKVTRKNYVIKVYVSGNYLDRNVSLERETFNFDKERPTLGFDISQKAIERQAAEEVKKRFEADFKVRSGKKAERIREYVDREAPWHKSYLQDVDFSSFGYNLTNEKIELELQKFKFQKEQETKIEVAYLMHEQSSDDFSERLEKVMGKVTDMGKSDLAHYVCNRKIVLDIFDQLREREEDGSVKLEEEIHSLIFPMNADSDDTPYEQHNLWLLDERLVFSDYVASDRKISKKKDAYGEPDLVVVSHALYDVSQFYRSGENEYSNPLTIFEFKRPKRVTYKQDDDPVLQIARYLDKIRAGKYEMPKGKEPIKVNQSTPVYAYIVCDIVDKIKEFAKLHQLTMSPDGEGYFGFHSGYGMYIEVMSYKKLMKDASMRNKIFFKKLHLE